jgi:hypothetical protein
LSTFPVSIADWQQFIRDYSADLLRLKGEDKLYDADSGDVDSASIADAHRAAAWLGHDPASEEEVAAAEQRLGMRLPPSYRNFLLASNGLIGPGTPWFYALLPARHVDWLRNGAGMRRMLDDGWTPDVYGEEMSAMFRRALWPVPDGDGDYWLLDPGDTRPDGEWTAYIWWCSNGETPEPYPSFGAMMAHEHASMVRALSESVNGSLSVKLVPWSE